jgi:hypothetical protein
MDEWLLECERGILRAVEERRCEKDETATVTGLVDDYVPFWFNVSCDGDDAESRSDFCNFVEYLCEADDDMNDEPDLNNNAQGPKKRAKITTI